MRECLNCGMLMDDARGVCLKCDAVLADQTDGSIVTIDIAHHGERVADAARKLKSVLRSAKQDYTLAIRVIVGRGLIKDDVISQLHAWQRSGKIRHFEFEGGNQGVLMVFLRSNNYSH